MANKWEEPPEIRAIKDYVLLKFQAKVGVTMQDKQIIINVPGAALAGALRMQIYDLQKQLKTNKKLFIRIER